LVRGQRQRSPEGRRKGLRWLPSSHDDQEPEEVKLSSAVLSRLASGATQTAAQRLTWTIPCTGAGFSRFHQWAISFLRPV